MLEDDFRNLLADYGAEVMACVQQGDRDRLSGLVDGALNELLSIPLLKALLAIYCQTAGVCPECDGEKWIWVNHGSDGYSQDDCPTCKGAGKAPQDKELQAEGASISAGRNALDRPDLRDAIQTLIDNYDSTLPIDEACPHCKITEDIMLLFPDNKQAVKAEKARIMKALEALTDRDGNVTLNMPVLRAQGVIITLKGQSLIEGKVSNEDKRDSH